MTTQLSLFLHKDNQLKKETMRLRGSPLENLVRSLSDDLNFQETSKEIHLSHKAHSFPAKFPPELPRKFILELTDVGDVVLDQMMGSGTTVLEAYLNKRRAIGFDIDPLAILLTRMKLQIFNASELYAAGKQILGETRKVVKLYPDLLRKQKENRYNPKAREFLDYWFTEEVQLELLALLIEIEKIDNAKIRDFFQIIFSSIIITKSGGVSLALDLAHTRPHKAKTVLSKDGELVWGDKNEKKRHLIKNVRSPLREFEKKLSQNLRGVIEVQPSGFEPAINFGSALALSLPANSVDLIVTSPPYASNAIGYMRAHKFSLVWFGYPIESLTEKRKTYIGSEGLINLPKIELPTSVEKLVTEIGTKSKKKNNSLRRYYTEMTLVLQEMFRVLKHEKSAIVVVGNSVLAGLDAQVEDSLVAIGQKIGFDVPAVGIRQLDRNRRMLPAGSQVDMSSQIQQRMHEEYVIGFYKP